MKRVLFVGQPEKVFARYGLRGVRVGEASHPNPSFLLLRRATSVVICLRPVQRAG